MTRKSGRVFLPRNYCHHDVAPVPLIAPENKKKKGPSRQRRATECNERKKNQKRKKRKGKMKKSSRRRKRALSRSKKISHPRHFLTRLHPIINLSNIFQKRSQGSTRPRFRTHLSRITLHVRSTQHTTPEIMYIYIYPTEGTVLYYNNSR